MAIVVFKIFDDLLAHSKDCKHALPDFSSSILELLVKLKENVEKAQNVSPFPFTCLTLSLSTVSPFLLASSFVSFQRDVNPHPYLLQKPHIFSQQNISPQNIWLNISQNDISSGCLYFKRSSIRLHPYQCLSLKSKPHIISW